MDKAWAGILFGMVVIFGVLLKCSEEDLVPYQGSYGVDHACTQLDLIPDARIDSIKEYVRIHYAHTSHGSQLTTGMTRVEEADPFFNVAIGYSELPSEPNALNMFDGQENETYITPELYWQAQEGMDCTRAVLNNNPDINVSMWCWCCQCDDYSVGAVQEYLDSLAVLESEFPNVIFVYMTGNAQATGVEGYNRYQRNQQIRNWCDEHDKICFDFADLDSWWYNANNGEWEQATYEYNGAAVPMEHPQFHGDEAGHTTYESCEQKGRALWWLLAVIAGWNPANIP